MIDPHQLFSKIPEELHIVNKITLKESSWLLAETVEPFQIQLLPYLRCTLIQFLVFLQLNQMVNIWSNHDALSQFVQQLLLGCSNQFCIQNPDFPHSNAKVVIFPQTTK